MRTFAPVSPRVGAQLPSLCYCPAGADRGIGEEAIELAADVGLVLDEWQARIVRATLYVRPDGKWLCFECGAIVSRQNGKGSIAEARVLAGLFLLGERLIMWSAHEYKTAMEAFRRVRAYVDGSDDLRKQVRRISNTNGEESIELLDGARLRFIARSKGSGRGFTGDVNIIDEAYAYTADQQAALMPTMSARPNPQILYLSSPPLDGETGEPLYALRDRAKAGNEPSLAWFDWGIDFDPESPEGLAKAADPETWYLTNPALGIRITEETVERERRSMSPTAFARERLCVWPPKVGGDGMIDPKVWATLLDEYSTAPADVAFALDVTPDRQRSAIVAYGTRDDGIGHVEVIEYRSGTEWVVERLVELRARWNPIAVAVDVKGPAVSLLLDLQAAGFEPPATGEEPERAQLFVPTAQELAAGCGQFVDAVVQRTIRHIGQGPLDIAVAGAKSRPLGDAWAWARRAASVDISPLCGATLARLAYVTRYDVVNADYDVLASI